MSEKVYVPAIRCFPPRETAASFVLGSMIIDVHGLVDWINGPGQQYLSEYTYEKNGEKKTVIQLKLDVLQSDKTGVNIQVNTYKKK